MNKNTAFLIVLFILCSLVGYLFFDKSSEKIVVINSDKVLQSYDGFKEAQDEYEKKVEAYKETYKKQNELLRLKNAEYEKGKTVLTKEDKLNKEKELITIQNSLIKLDNVIKTKSKEEEEKLLKGIYNKVNDFIKRYCEANKIKVVIGANGTGNVVYNAPSVDKTEEIILLLNSEYLNGIN